HLHSLAHDLLNKKFSTFSLRNAAGWLRSAGVPKIFRRVPHPRSNPFACVAPYVPRIHGWFESRCGDIYQIFVAKRQDGDGFKLYGATHARRARTRTQPCLEYGKKNARLYDEITYL